MPSLNPSCQNCELHKTTRGTVCLAGEGPKGAEIMFVGEAPGAKEEKTGRPFMGDSGQVLRQELRRNGLTSVYITNVVKCRPPGNETPSVQQAKACREYLDYEIQRIKPKVVVALGATAAKALFTGKTKVTEHHGSFIPPEKHPFTGYICYHPAYALRDPSKLPAFKADIARLARTMRGESRKVGVKWNLVRRGNYETFLREFRQAPEFSFDLETSGLFMHDKKGWINAIIIGLPNRTWVIPLMRPGLYPGRKNPKKKKFHRGSPWTRGKAGYYLMKALFRLARGAEKKAVGQNAKFDNLWLMRYYGDKFFLHFDTMLASHTIDENVEHGLKSLARTYLDVPDYDLSTSEKRGNVAPMKLYQYGSYDGAYTLALRPLLEQQLRKEPELVRLFYRLVMPAARAFEDIELEGLTIDFERMKEIGLELKDQKMDLEGELNLIAGRKVNWNSPPQVAEVLFEDLELKATVLTPRGAPSTSEEALIGLITQHPIIEKLFKYREISKFLSTYIEGLQEFMVGDKLYVSYKIHGTVTGRYSSRIHSIPRDGSIRNLVTAPRGWKFVQGDISQAELRIAAQLSGDLMMRKCFKDGKPDIHWLVFLRNLGSGGSSEYSDKARSTARKLLGSGGRINFSDTLSLLLQAGHEKCIKIWSGWKEGRKRGKATSFGYLYGMYEKKFIQTAKVKYGWEPSWDEAHQSRVGFFETFPDIPRWHEKQKKLVKINGFVRNLFGRRRRLPGIFSKDKGVRMEAERQAINSPVQGTIGDWKAAIVVEIHETIDRDKLRVVGEHHDAALMIVREGCEDEVLPQVLEIMRSPKLLKTFKIKLDIPMEGELEVGPWGAGKRYFPPA